MGSLHSRKPVIILIIGAWHTPVHYADLVEELRSRGFRVVVDAGPGNDRSVPPRAHLQDLIDHFRALLLSHLEAGDDVTLVMHSYGGVVGTHGTLGLVPGDIDSHPSKPTGRIRSLVYIAGHIPPREGELENLMVEYSFPWLQVDTSNTMTFLDPELSREGLYHDLTPDQQNFALANIQPFALHLFVEARASTAGKTPAYATIPTTCIYCSDDRQFPVPAAKRAFARIKREVGVDVEQVLLEGASHSPMISMPAAVADVVEKAC